MAETGVEMEIDSFNRCSIEAKADSVLNSDSSSDRKETRKGDLGSIRTQQVDVQ
jgi:hypothetical protein